MRVREWMSPDPVCVSPETTVARAREILGSEGFRHLPVVSDRRLVGIISDRDVAIRGDALRSALRRNEVDRLLDDDRPVAAVMTAGPHIIGPDAPVSEASRLLVSRWISAIPVVDDDGVLVGIISSVDCLLAALEHADGAP